MGKITRRPFMLIIRDGWGTNPHPEWNHANAIHLANTPVDDRLMSDYPHVLIHTSGHHVGLPDGIMGNSEVGHQNIGAGRIVDQEIMRITGRIEDGTFFDNAVLGGAFERATASGGAVHIMGLCSDVGVHSILPHLYALIELAKRSGFPGDRVFVHVIGDGRDSAPTSGIEFVRQIEAKLAQIGVGRIASVIGRYYAMDRDHRWERVEQAYRLYTEGRGRRAAGADEAFQWYYDHPTEESRRGDEFIEATAISDDGSKPLATIQDGDSVIFFNFRGDRPRELTKAFVYDEFPFASKSENGAPIGFERAEKKELFFVTTTAYEKGLPVRVAFSKPPKMRDILGSFLADQGLRQFRCAETEKYPHVTYFFNDYRDEPFPNEHWQLVPSPRDVSTYDQKPQMSAYEITDAVLRRLQSHRDDLLLINFANGDMVGHTGNLSAAVRAVEVVDECVGSVVEAVRAKGGRLIVTADHGNAEQ
ncbi:MAG: 2,3-bisphosphoglycerate-independent phosphoglycerate mutase, partial [Planctomycetes bacterium]|nr:2,3-bisphosphoglycerate-independent phosphoglycerate mutase [Planctomycetota bacterium]